MKTHLTVSAGTAFALALSSSTTHASAANPPSNLIGLTARANALVQFNAGAAGRPMNSIRITGLAVGEDLIGIDYRSATGDLYGLTTARKVYTLDPVSGASTLVGGPFTGPLVGIEFGFDFNPVPDRIRVVGDSSGQSLRLNPNNGALAGTDTLLAYKAGDPNFGATPHVVAVAYTENYAGTNKTTLYGIDSTRDVLVRIGGVDGVPSPNGGELTTIGALGVNTIDQCGLDISPNGGAYAVIMTASNISELYSLNLTTGAATRIDRSAGDVVMRDLAIVPPSNPRVFAATADNRLVSFRPGTPSTLLSDSPVTGLQSGETLFGLDFRPSTGDLLALGSAIRVYTIDTTTAVATVVGAGFAPALSGAAFGFDFNPVPDRIRVVSESDVSARLHPDTGALAGTDTSVDFAVGDVNAGQPRTIFASAYTDDFAGTTKTTLYGIDSALDILVRQGGVDGTPSPNGGALTTIGALGTDTSLDTNFDISPYGGAFATFTAPAATSSSFATVNLATGATTSFGTIGGSSVIVAMAYEVPLAPRVLAVTPTNKLVTFAPGRPATILSNVTIQGLDSGENVLGFDFRPSTGELLAVTSQNRLQRIDANTGFAVPVLIASFAPTLTSNLLGVDFNSIPDRYRVVNANEQNLRLVPNRGALGGVDTLLAYAAADSGFGLDPRILGVAYTSNFGGTTSTTLYGIDSTRDVLVTQGGLDGTPSPNGGQLFTIGALGVDTGDFVGLDVTPRGAAFAALDPGSGTTSNLYSVNLTTGAVTSIGAIGGGEPIVDLAVLIRGL